MTSTAQRVLVTGANGAIGQALRKRLNRESDYAVTYLVGPDAPPEARLPADVEIDVTDSACLSEFVAHARPDVILHLAAITGSACELNPALAWEINADSVETVARAALASHARRVVLASTAGVYGDRYVEPVGEDAVLNPSSDYARAKVEAEEALARAASESKTLTSVVLRIFNVFGPQFPQSLVTRLKNSTQDQPVTLNGLDQFVRDYIHVDDVVDAILLSIAVDMHAPHTIFNIGSGLPLSNRALVEAIAAQQPVYATIGAEQASFSCANISRAHRDLGFTPVRTVSD